MEAQRGHYLGTEIGGVWHRRYRKHGWLARGLGEHWIEGDLLSSSFVFTRTAAEAAERAHELQGLVSRLGE